VSDTKEGDRNPPTAAEAGVDHQGPASTGDEPSGFDAVAAAAELDELLGADATGGGGPTTEEGQVAELEQEIADLGVLLQKADQETNQARMRAERAEAEVERAKERVARDGAREVGEKVNKVLLSFLEVLDDLDRALVAARDMDHNPAVLDGVVLVRKRFMAALAKHDVAPMNALGAPFDPNLHEAMTAIQVDDPSQHNLVVQVLREGYTIGDQVLRPAGVAVGKRS
jgi:molecular chaperone GrpE